LTQRLRGKIVNAAHEKPRNFGLGCAVYLGLFLGYMFVLNPLLLTMVERNGAAHGFWSFVIVIGGAVAVIAWTSARTNAQTALKMKELEDRRLQEAAELRSRWLRPVLRFTPLSNPFSRNSIVVLAHVALNWR